MLHNRMQQRYRQLVIFGNLIGNLPTICKYLYGDIPTTAAANKQTPLQDITLLSKTQVAYSTFQI